MKTELEFTNGDILSGQIVKFDYDKENYECIFTVDTRLGVITVRESELESPRNPNCLIVTSMTEDHKHVKCYTNITNIDSDYITTITKELSPFFSVHSWRMLSGNSLLVFLEPTPAMEAFLND